jgi:hypothetical protein
MDLGGGRQGSGLLRREVSQEIPGCCVVDSPFEDFLLESAETLGKLILMLKGRAYQRIEIGGKGQTPDPLCSPGFYLASARDHAFVLFGGRMSADFRMLGLRQGQGRGDTQGKVMSGGGQGEQ